MNVRKILCPIDFSAGSQQSMQLAVRLATEADAQLVLYHVWYVPPGAYTAGFMLSPSVFEEVSEAAQRGLDDAMKEATSAGATRVTTKLANGLPWTMIVGELEDPSYDLVVVGTHGRTGVARIVLGSVAEKIVRHAPCSVLVVRPEGEIKSFTHILVLTDFSESSQNAANLAVTLVQPGGQGITLLHIVDVPVAYCGEPQAEGFIRDLDTHASVLLEKWATLLRTRTTVPITVRSRIGSPGGQTLKVLDLDPTIDLVVMGSHGRTGLARALLGSVAEKIVRYASCPVLVARKR
jgi:nucleotide-binding universal stress UspA family protein